MIPHPDIESLLSWLIDEELRAHILAHNISSPVLRHEKEIEEQTYRKIISHIQDMHHKQNMPHLRR
jgi:hypothetical protein